MFLTKCLLQGVMVSMLLVVCCFGITITVDGDDPCADFNSIQEAIDNSMDDYVIVVQPGIYNERINFYGKAITVTSPEPNNIYTVYSTTIDGGDQGNTVTFDSGEDDSSKLVGMIIQGGNDKGIYCYYSNPHIDRCIIRYNHFGIYGGNSAPIITDSQIRENDWTGVMDCDGDISNCLIQENARHGIEDCDGLIFGCEVRNNLGRGMSQCLATIEGCIVHANSDDGIFLDSKPQANIRITNSVISGNEGCGMEYHASTAIDIWNCTIVGNAEDGVYNWKSSTMITNTIICKNKRYGLVNTYQGETSLKYNNIWGNIVGNYDGLAPGTTDTHENPLFAVDGYWDSNTWVEGDYHLKSIAGRWQADTHSWVNDDVTSPCIDAGDPIGGFLYEPMPNGGRINQGAYGGTIYASKSPWGPEPYCAEHIPGDVNDDCRLNLLDIGIIASYWLECNLVPQEACND